MLVTANRSRVSIRGRPRKIFLTCSLLTVSLILCARMRACRRSQNLWGTTGPRPLAGECSWRPRNTLLHCMCYHTKFRRSTSNRLGVNYGNPPENFDPSRPAFQVHSRSLELTLIDRLPITSY